MWEARESLSEVTNAMDTSSPARRSAITGGDVHQEQPLRGHHGRSVQSIQAFMAQILRVHCVTPLQLCSLQRETLPCHDI
jgi:hypothetical protein